MKTSDSSSSRYCGNPLSVLRVIAGSESDQPMPNGPLPEPESYESSSFGPKSDRAGLTGSGIVNDPVPVTGLAENFSPMPRIAPPPFGNAIAGGVEAAALDSFAVPLAAGALNDASEAATCGEALGLSRSLRNEITLTWWGEAGCWRPIKFYQRGLAAVI